jgi:hypothetical protein
MIHIASIFLALIVFISFCSIASAAIVSGKVIDIHGSPISGAKVRINTDHDSDIIASSGIFTDRYGNFSTKVTHSAKGAWKYQCFIEAKGCGVSGAILDPGEYDIFTLMPAVPMTGSVTDEAGKPISGIEIDPIRIHLATKINGKLKDFYIASYNLPDSQKYNTKTNLAGKYTINKFPAGCIVTVADIVPEFIDKKEKIKIPGLPPQTIDNQKPIIPKYALIGTQNPPGSDKFIALILTKPVPIHGRVIFSDGKPAEDISITLTPVDHSYKFPTSSVTLAFPKEGFSFRDYPPGEYTIRLSACSLNKTYKGKWVLPPAILISTIAAVSYKVPDLVVRKSGYLTGLILDAETHKPIPGTQIGFTRMADFLPIHGVYNAIFNSPMATTNAAGRFWVSVPPGKSLFYIYDLPSKFISDWSSENQYFTGIEQKTVELHTIYLRRTESLNIKVVDTHNQPVAGLGLKLYPSYPPPEGESYYQGNESRTNLDGTIEFSSKYQPNNYVCFNTEGYDVLKPSTINLPSKDSVTIVVNKVVCMPLVGTVTDQSGHPLSDVMFGIVLHTMASNHTDLTLLPMQTTSDDHGHFKFDSVPVNPLRVSIQGVGRKGYKLKSMSQIKVSNGLATISILLSKYP